MILELFLVFCAFCVVLLMAFWVANYALRERKEISLPDLKKGQKIIAFYKDEKRPAMITANHSDIKVIYAKTDEAKPLHIRVEYKEVLEVVK